MSERTIKFQSDESVLIQAIDVCLQLGIDVPTYLRMCLSRLVKENGIPFAMKFAPESDEERQQRRTRDSGISESILNEIDEEIRLVREERAQQECSIIA